MAQTQIPREYMINIKGKDFVTYAGLLKMTHDIGIQSLSVSFLDVTPSIATAAATLQLADGRVFSECGEATPDNVSKGVRSHFARVALTRAKARAMRDALNIDAACAEEIDDHAPRQEAPRYPSGNMVTAAPPPVEEQPASAKQFQEVAELLSNTCVAPNDALPLMERHMPKMGAFQARAIIEGLKEGQGRLGDQFMLAYVGMLRERYERDKGDVVAWLEEHAGRKNPAGLSADLQWRLVQWLKGEEESAPQATEPVAVAVETPVEPVEEPEEREEPELEYVPKEEEIPY